MTKRRGFRRVESGEVQSIDGVDFLLLKIDLPKLPVIWHALSYFHEKCSNNDIIESYAICLDVLDSELLL